MRKIFILKDNPQILQWISNKKNPKSSRVDLNKVDNIQYGMLSKGILKKKKYLKGKENLCITITFEGKKTLNLLFPSSDFLYLWVSGLQILINDCYKIHKTQRQKTLGHLKQIFAQTDKDMNGTLDFLEAKKLMIDLNIFITDKELQAKFNEYDFDKSGNLDFQEFLSLMNIYRTRQEL